MTEIKFWIPQQIDVIKKGQERLINEQKHHVFKDAKKYDFLNLQTLWDFACALIQVHNNDWLAIPYDTGCQLYCRDIVGRPVTQNLDESRPNDSFFYSQRSINRKSSLFIAKNPRETMLLYQLFGKSVDVIGFINEDTIRLSERQKVWFKSLLDKRGYESIYLFFDCHTDEAYSMSKELSQQIKKIIGSLPVYMVNIFDYTSGNCKDITECQLKNMDINQFVSMLKRAEVIECNDSQHSPEQIILNSKEDLKLDESLIELLPDVIKDYLKFSSPLSDVPNEFLITPFLAILGALIGKRRYVKIGGITIYPTIWTALFAGSSTLRKSTALSLAKKMFKPIEKVLESKYESEFARWMEKKEICESRNVKFEEPEPIQRTLYGSDSFSDLTFWQAINENESLVSMPGEFTALWNELNKPRNGMKDLALSIFDAEDSIRRVTKSAGSIELNNPVWCMAGATTLDNFQRTLTSQERGSGLLQRILPVYMEERTKKFQALTELPEPDQELFESITQKLIPLINLETKPVSLSDQADQIFTQWNYSLNEKAEELSQSQSDIGGFASRLIAYGLKFALIFQQLDEQTEVISKQNMKAAIGLCDWLFNHIQYMLNHNYIFNRTYSDRLKIRSIIEKQFKGQINRTELMKRSHFSKKQLDKALDSEIESGFIREIRTGTAGRPLVEYALVGNK